MFLARLLAYGVVVGSGDGGCGRDIFRFLYIARDKPGDKQNATAATTVRSPRRGVRFHPAASKPRSRRDPHRADANGNQMRRGEEDRPTRRCDSLCRGKLAKIDRKGDWRGAAALCTFVQPKGGLKSRPPTRSLTHSLGRPFGDDFPYALKSRSLCPLVESPGYKQVLFIMIVDVVPELTTIRAIGRAGPGRGRTERRRGPLSRSSPPSIRGRDPLQTTVDPCFLSPLSD